ncbi:hypothetical protein OG323_14660 [Streptomyces cyaneofuscatus]|uniref:hypothetical protein n=1 Tax=Streptomyces cyaneofuscatus TaxID=66883 RepID=UPI003864223C|nr:hypothetical protein OG323_14660 [Streptomyces cyaneofuscatus]
MSAPSMGDLSAAVTALASLTVRFPDLPGVAVRITTVYPDQLELAAHDDLSAFEAWREALGIDPEDVVHGVQSGGMTRVLDAHTVFMGARLRLIGFAKVPALGASLDVAA